MLKIHIHEPFVIEPLIFKVSADKKFRWNYSFSPYPNTNMFMFEATIIGMRRDVYV